MNDGTITAGPGFSAGTGERFGDSTTEHISLGDEFTQRRNEKRTLSDTLTLRDPLRGRQTVFKFYAQGFLELDEKRPRNQHRSLSIDLRYLDPTPTVERRYSDRLFQAASITAAAGIVTGILAALGIAPTYTATAAAVALTATVVAAIACVYRSHERIRFHTLHGRAVALQLEAGVGAIRRYREMLPDLVGAIEAAGESVSDDTMVYLRSEMREHYRLREAGVLSETECSESTSRILAYFDGPL